MKTILLLHGAIGSMEQLNPIKDQLSAHYKVYSFNFSGHGGQPFEKLFSIEQFADEVLLFLKANNVSKTSIFGYSMGGYVALYLAKNNPQLFESIITLGTKLHWDASVADREIAMLQPVKIEAKLPEFAKELERRHHPNDWKMLLQKTAEMLQELADTQLFHLQDFGSIVCPVLLIVGDKDNSVTLVETVSVYKQLKSGQLAVLPGTPHAIEKVNLETLTAILIRFFNPN